MFKITVVEIKKPADQAEPPIVRYEQTVDDINLRAIMAAVNSTPRRSRAKKPVTP